MASKQEFDDLLSKSDIELFTDKKGRIRTVVVRKANLMEQCVPWILIPKKWFTKKKCDVIIKIDDVNWLRFKAHLDGEKEVWE